MRQSDADALLEQLAEVVRRANENAAHTGNRSSELTWDMAVKYIKNAPTIELGQKRGIWTDSSDGIICSNCGYKLGTTGLLSHCTHCFANMEEEYERKN